MRQVLTERQREFVELAGQHAEVFAARAATHDRDNSFPFDNYHDMRDSGFLRLTLPEEFGGMGVTLAELLPAVERLAMGDASTALAVIMHLSPLGQWSGIWRRTGDERLERFLRGAAEGQVVWAAITAEAGSPNHMSDAATIATKVDGGYLLNGRKTFGTNSAVATHASTTARCDDPARGSRLLLCRIPLSNEAVRIHPTWDVMGMRGTQSNDVEFVDLFVDDDAVAHSLPVGHLDARVLETTFSWSMATFGAVYTGIAAGALHWTAERVNRQGTSASTQVQHSLAEVELLIEQSRAALYRHAEDVGSRRMFEQLGVQEGFARCAFVKYVCTNNAVAAMTKLVEVLGGAAYSRRLPFERMWRDVQAGVMMPFGNHTARDLIGATTVGARYAPVIGFAETGHHSRPKVEGHVAQQA